MSLLALSPLLVALVTTLATGLYILKRKSLAQAHCLQQAAVLQNELKETLDQLMRLNPRAKTLRAQRKAANQALEAALQSLNPYAIAAAQAYWNAVVLSQMALKARQEFLLGRAERQRQAGHRELRERVRSLGVRAIESRRNYWRALAVEARPIDSLTPDYVPVPTFGLRQQHRFRFEIDLKPPFAKVLPEMNLKQTTECAVTLEGGERQWKLKVLAANARSNWSWF